MSNINIDKLRKSMLLYAVTDRFWLGENQTLYGECEKAIKEGVTLLQLREKKLSNAEFIEEGLKIKDLCHKNNIKLIINDDVSVMLAIDADGIHVGQDDGDVKKIRELIGPNKILGVSTQSVEQSRKAITDGADYLGIGAVFSTSTKLDAIDVSSTTLKEITRLSSIPTCAIGGITLENIKELEDTGINGCAIVSAIFDSCDVAKSTRALRKECDSAFYKYNVANHIYDLDGTLIDSLGIWENLASSYLEDKNIAPKNNLDEIVKNLSLDESSSYLKENYNLDESTIEIKGQIVNKIYNLYANSIKLKSGVRDHLQNIYNKKITLSIASASSKELVNAVLKNNDIDKYFTIIKTEEEVGESKSKSSLIYDEICKDLNIEKDDVIVFEDSDAAIKTLRCNAYYSIGVYDRHSTDSVEDICDYYIKEFKDC